MVDSYRALIQTLNVNKYNTDSIIKWKPFFIYILEQFFVLRSFLILYNCIFLCFLVF